MFTRKNNPITMSNINETLDLVKKYARFNYLHAEENGSQKELDDIEAEILASLTKIDTDARKEAVDEYIEFLRATNHNPNKNQ
jgi:hypothetical protein